MGTGLTILDERRTWAQPLYNAATARGYATKIVSSAKYATRNNGLVFFRPHAHPQVLKKNQEIDWPIFRDHFTPIQDDGQVMTYDNKSEQFRRWGRFMPATFRYTDMEQAMEFLRTWNAPLVFKADVGASSVNVKIVDDLIGQMKHVETLFKHGISQNHCCGGSGGKSVLTTQRGYVLMQEKIDHEVTWRVNAIGRLLAAFKRKNFPDRMVAQTGNVEPVMEMTDQIESLFAFADEVFIEIGSKWCALDILWDAIEQRWRLLETSLAWPWPSPGDCMEAPFFGSERKWGHMWDAMLDQYETGVWG